MFKFKFVARTASLLLLLLLLGGVNLAKAQSVSAYLGFGAATDKSSGQQLECSINTAGCDSGIVSPDVGPALTGAFGVFGADFMWKPKLGFGGEYSWRLSQGAFAPQEDVTYRPNFYDFNVIYHPLGKGSRVVPEIQGGIGGVNIKFYETQSGCVASNIGCETLSQYFASSNHFQVHGSVGVRLYVKGGLYIRPQVDLRWVDNFVEFGSDFVPEYTVAVGYTFGGH